MSKYDAYYKDMSESGLKKLERYGFKRHTSEEDGVIYWIYYEYGGLWLDVEYIPSNPEYIPSNPTSDEYEMDKRVIGNGEFHLDDEFEHLSFGDMEMLCKLYKDGLIEFKEMPGTAYQIQYGEAEE